MPHSGARPAAVAVPEPSAAGEALLARGEEEEAGGAGEEADGAGGAGVKAPPPASPSPLALLARTRKPAKGVAAKGSGRALSDVQLQLRDLGIHAEAEEAGEEGEGAGRHPRRSRGAPPSGSSRVAQAAGQAGPARGAAPLSSATTASAGSSPLSIASRMYAHRRRFLLDAVTQESREHVAQRAALLDGLRAAEARAGGRAEADALREDVRRLDAAFTRRKERVAALSLVIAREQEEAAGGAGGSNQRAPRGTRGAAAAFDELDALMGGHIEGRVDEGEEGEEEGEGE
jgi:hypothetical protein